MCPSGCSRIRHDPQKPPFRVLINGQTGAIHGKAPSPGSRSPSPCVLVLALIAAPFVLAAARDRGRDPAERRGAARPLAAAALAPTERVRPGREQACTDRREAR